jgi:hypothetical protein
MEIALSTEPVSKPKLVPIELDPTTSRSELTSFGFRSLGTPYKDLIPAAGQHFVFAKTTKTLVYASEKSPLGYYFVIADDDSIYFMIYILKNWFWIPCGESWYDSNLLSILEVQQREVEKVYAETILVPPVDIKWRDRYKSEKRPDRTIFDYFEFLRYYLSGKRIELTTVETEEEITEEDSEGLQIYADTSIVRTITLQAKTADEDLDFSLSKCRGSISIEDFHKGLLFVFTDGSEQGTGAMVVLKNSDSYIGIRKIKFADEESDDDSESDTKSE